MNPEDLKIREIAQGKVTKELVQSWLREHDYTETRWKTFQKAVTRTTAEGSATAVYRFKLSAVMARKEVRSADGERWFRVASGYYKKLSVNANGQLVGMER